MKKIVIYISLIFLSCDKLVELPENNSFISKEAILSNEALLQSFVGSIYHDLYLVFNNDGETGSNPTANLSFILGAIADEFEEARAFTAVITRNAFYNTYYTNEPGTNIPDFFTPLYNLIVRCNTVLDDFLSTRPGQYRQEIAEVRAIRAILYFHLVQIYGDIPLLTSADVELNLQVSRTSPESIYAFCIKDLEEVYASIDSDKSKIDKSATQMTYTERVNRDVIAYYLSAFYLLSKDYPNSIKYSLEIKSAYGFTTDFSQKFKGVSTENIWLLNSPSFSNTAGSHKNNANASFLNHKIFGTPTPFAGGSRPLALSNRLADDFNHTDKRRANYLDSVMDNGVKRYLPYKYRIGGAFDLGSPERFVLIRLPAVYFNLVEAYFQNGQKAESIAVFNEICRINYTNYVDVSDITLETIVQERFKELFSENGDRWFTLKRTNLVDKVMADYLPRKNNNAEPWSPAKMLYLPIPFNTLQLNPNL